jgi:methyltransferase
MVTPWVFLALVALLAAQRLMELRISARHERALRQQGAREAGRGHMPWMRLMHASWLVAMPLEVFLLDRPFIPLLALIAFAGVIAGQALRYGAIRALGERWTVNIMVLPEAPPVAGGIYRHVRHPNYLGVILEIAFFPLLHGAWITALSFTILNGLVLRTRIRAEEAALRQVSDYDAALGDRPRFIPGG